jgi:hypothetical protein
VAVVKTNFVNISDRLAKIEKTIDDIRFDGGQILSRISSLEPPPRQPAPPATPAPDSVVAGFYVTEGEAKLLREFQLAASGSSPSHRVIARCQRPAYGHGCRRRENGRA